MTQPASRHRLQFSVPDFPAILKNVAPACASLPRETDRPALSPARSDINEACLQAYPKIMPYDTTPSNRKMEHQALAGIVLACRSYRESSQLIAGQIQYGGLWKGSLGKGMRTKRQSNTWSDSVASAKEAFTSSRN